MSHSDNRDKQVIVHGEYTQEYYSPLRHKRIRLRLSIMDVLVFFSIIALIFFLGYRSLESYGIQSRDDIRTGHLAIIREGIEKLVSDGKQLPIGYNEKQIISQNTLLGVQGYAGESLFAAIGKTVLKDPLDNTYYTYYYEPKSQRYEVMAFLESTRDTKNDTPLWKRVVQWIFRPIDYANRKPYSIGTPGNILLSNVGTERNTPLNQLIEGSRIDLSDTESYSNHLYLAQSCKDILLKDSAQRERDGNHLLLINGRITKAYCNMTTDGGGWTLFYANNGHKDSPIAESYVQMRDKMKKGIYTLTDYHNPNLAGLYDTTHFTTNGAREILATNRIGGGGKWVKFTFDTSESLSWSLGKDVLGKTNSGCYTLPNNGSWSIINNDAKIKYDNLRQIMNHKGTSWGISHTSHQCNNYTKNQSTFPHIAFYSATNNLPEGRTRGTEGIGQNQFENEFRYFIR